MTTRPTPESYTVKIEQITDEHRGLVGAKAARLGSLHRLGYRIPGGFCVTVEAYRSYMSLCGLQRWWELPRTTLERLKREFMEREFPKAIQTAVADELRLMRDRFGKNIQMAVRSSGVLEDSASKSFAGLYRTLLRRESADQVLDAIKQCWLSSMSPDILRYLEKFSCSPESNEMAVLIQVMVEGELSGVLFTANPATGNPNELIIDAVPGICEPVVSGEDPSVHIVVDREDKERHGKEQELLSLDRMDSLITAAESIEKRLGEGSQDIEWSFQGTDLYILQCRPLTGLPYYFPIGDGDTDRGRGWKLAFIGLFSPFGCSLEKTKYEVYRTALERTTGRREKHGQRVLNGYLYEWSEPSAVSRLSPMPIVKTIVSLVRADRIYKDYREAVVPRYLHAIDTVLSKEQQAESVDEMIGHLDELVTSYLEFQESSLGILIPANHFPRLLKRFCFLTRAANRDVYVLSLIVGEQSDTSRMNAAYESLCESLGSKRLAGKVLRASTWPEAKEDLKATSAGQQFLGEWERFYDQYGYTWAVGNPKDPGWEEDSSAMLVALKRALQHEGASLSQRTAAARIQRSKNENEIARNLRPVLRKLFAMLLDRSRRFFPVREDRNHQFYRGVAAIRTTLLRMGAMLEQEGLLESPDDVFYLTYEEVKKLSREAYRSRMRETVSRRRREYTGYRRLQPPTRLRGDGEAKKERERQMEGGGCPLIGRACSPGSARGLARIVHDPRELGKLRSGEILVISKIRPYFSTRLGVAAAIVTEEGSLLSHGANIAREYGIPAVMGVKSVTATIRDGDVLIVDGSEGTVIVQQTLGS